MNNLKSVLENLKSDKIKDRQEALVSIRNAFTDRVVAGFHIKRDSGESQPKVWLPVYQALFNTVTIEKIIAKKKSTAKSGTSSSAAIRRLSDAASIIRWLVERSVQYMNKKVALALFHHLMQMLPADRSPDARLFAPVALDYAKALKCLVGYAPHLEHLDESMWVKLVETSFNVILDDPISVSFAGHEEEGIPNEVDSDMYVDDGEVAEGPDSDDLPSTSRKRPLPRNERTPTPMRSPRKSQARPRQRNPPVVALEQIEFASILSIMISSPIAPILSENYPGLASGILVRLERFLDRYPTDSSLLHDFLTTLSSTLRHVSFNKTYEVARFARSTWPSLVGLWGTKDKRMKEGLIVVLRNLLPYTICPVYMDDIKLPSFQCAKEIGRLRDLLDNEAESRWGVDGLSLEALRLEIMDSEEDHSSKSGGIFIAKTFRAGWNFDAEQALSWAILELHADCLGILFQLSETMDSTVSLTPSRRETKRTKILDPISAILESLHSSPKPVVRSYRLQALLFFIDRHWQTVHDELKERVVQTLLQYVGIDDATVQSWVFLNFAAIAYAEGSKAIPCNGVMLNSLIWDSIWTHATRRTNVPAICRAACHAGQAVLVTNSKTTDVLLTTHRILLEIETLAKDMDVQGPAYPYDSVCIFLSHCLTIASQDARLYRMQLEDKVLSWLVDTWKISGNRMKMTPNTVQDVLLLLQAICGLSKKTNLITRPLLPQSQIVESVVEENKIKIIQDYVLYAKVPPFVVQHAKTSTSLGRETGSKDARPDRAQLVTPRGRERKVSSFLLKTLEALSSEWDLMNDPNSHPTAETVRRFLDMAITALLFEASLVLNGTASNRQVIQIASKLISSLVSLLTHGRWTTTEKLLIAHALEVLVNDEQMLEEDVFREALSPPGPSSGIKAQTLQNLLRRESKDEESSKALRLQFLRLFWQNADVRDALDLSMKTLRSLLSQFLKGASNEPHDSSTGVDDKDGFGPIRTTTVQSLTSNIETGDHRSIEHIFQICVGFISYGPFLQSHSAEPTRDKELTQLVVDGAGSNPERFSILCPIFFNITRKGILQLPVKYLAAFFEEFGSLLEQYLFSRSERFHRVVLDLLTSSLGIWNSQDAKAEDVYEQFRQLCSWFSIAYDSNNIRSWSLRDAFSRFLDRYLSEDPTQQSWLFLDDTINEENFRDFLPDALLPRLNSDPDMRVRFRVAVTNTRLFSQTADMVLYNRITACLSKDVNMFEHMLTRMLALGNIMIVSATLRRGAYWHLLEACIHSIVYSKHIEAILVGTSERLGIVPLSSLFEVYASQMAFAVHQAQADFMNFPPHLLGYRDKRQCAEATFHALTPTNIINNGTKTFATHCKILQKSAADGLQECFGDIVGFMLVYLLDNSRDSPYPSDELEQLIRERLAPIPDFNATCKENLDGIIIKILRSLGDQDCSEDGPIISALKASGDSQAVPTFRVLNKFRSSDTLQTHSLNLPTFPTKVVLQSITWLSSKFPQDFNKATTYHVIQGLMNEVHRTPLVSEQARLINALMLWMAYRHNDIKDRDIYETLVQGATLLLSQWDLARSAQSILDAVFRTYRKSAFADPHLPDLLIRICSIAHDYASNKENRTVSDLGISLADWIDGQVFEMATSGLESVILRALPAWPREPSAQLLPLFHRTTLQSLASVLEDPQIISNKFRIVRRFKDQAVEYGYDDNDDDFSKTYFWRLKDCMPPPELLQDEDVESFASLLALHHGQISSFDIEQPDSKESRNRHIRNYKKQTSGSKTYPAREAITLELLLMLESDDPHRVIAAYNTLRLVTAVPFHEDAQWQVPAEYRTRLEFFRAYRRTPKTRPLVDIHVLLRVDEYNEAASNFSRWVSLFTTLLSDSLAAIDPFFGQLSTIFATDIDFAEGVLPILVVTLLNCHRDTGPDSLSYKKILSDYFTAILSSNSTDMLCIRSIVDVVLHSRSFAPPTLNKDYLTYNKWVDLDFTLLARGAILCGAYTTALLFVELAAEQKPNNTQGNSVVEQVLYNIYAHIDEPDGFYGIKTEDLHRFLIKRFHHEQQWDKAFRFHGAALEAGIAGKGDEEGLVKSFHSFGFDHLAVGTLRNMSTDLFVTKHSSTTSYQLGWRTETWDLPDQAQDTASAPLYRSLRSIHRERDPRTVENTVRSALLQEMGHLRSLGSENLTEIRAVSRDLMCLSQIQEWTQAHKHESKPDVVLDKWTKFIGLDTRFEFGDLEAIMATRVSLIRSIRQREERRLIGTLVTPLVRGLRDIEKRCFVRLSEAARENGKIQVALNSIVRAQQLDMNTSPEVSEEFANVLLLQKEERSAVQFLQGLIERPDVTETSPDLGRKALRLSRLGTWTSDACLEKPSVIWERYFSPAIELLDCTQLDNPVSEASQSTIYRECAMFAERQYHAASKSPDAIRWKVYVERKKQEIEYRSAELANLAKSQLPNKETELQKTLKSDQALAHKLLSEDSAMFNKHSILREAFLKQAIDMHSRCLGTSSDFDNDSAIRFCSLWFANFDDLSILGVVKKGLDNIPSHKLVFLAHQLTARVANSFPTAPQQDNLQNLVLRMCREHPFHILYQVYCLSDHSHISDTNRRQSGRVSSQSTQATQATQTERGTAASNILDRLRNDSVTGQRVQDIERLCDAYLQWAKHPISKNSAFQRIKPPYDVPSSMKLLAIQNLKVPVTTSRTPVDPKMLYEDCEWIQGYERKFTTAGGVNLPKISVCKGSNGNLYKQLFKGEGKDDLRQDAVMEQVFDLVNGILRRDRETRRRQLRVRDYKVIPIASQAGLLEFVTNTAPMRDWLMTAHKNYRPQDEKPTDAYARMKKVQTEHRHNPEKQLEVFLQLKKRFQPVMRHYFTEKHKTPLSWYQMRLNYVRSVATTSIVGHVLGLGDRHTSNILLDNVNGDVIHIDLGIAFDQGKLLGVPERVPFRMTADMVDGMGISGTSGVFQRCAEETLRVLREESGVIMTVLEVFKHDPLHSWTASEIKVKQVQADAPVAATTVNDNTRYNLGIGIDMTSGTAEEAADRALSSVARKLDKSLSVESTVNELIAEATDLMNLATIFVGWAPYL